MTVTPHSERARQIAGKVSPAARERLLGDDNTGCPAGVAFFFVQHDLIEADPADEHGWLWSPLGLSVRQILQESPPQ